MQKGNGSLPLSGANLTALDAVGKGLGNETAHAPVRVQIGKVIAYGLREETNRDGSPAGHTGSFTLVGTTRQVQVVRPDAVKSAKLLLAIRQEKMRRGLELTPLTDIPKGAFVFSTPTAGKADGEDSIEALEAGEARCLEVVKSPFEERTVLDVLDLFASRPGVQTVKHAAQVSLRGGADPETIRVIEVRFLKGAPDSHRIVFTPRKPEVIANGRFLCAAEFFPTEEGMPVLGEMRPEFLRIIGADYGALERFSDEFGDAANLTKMAAAISSLEGEVAGRGRAKEWVANTATDVLKLFTGFEPTNNVLIDEHVKHIVQLLKSGKVRVGDGYRHPWIKDLLMETSGLDPRTNITPGVLAGWDEAAAEDPDAWAEKFLLRSYLGKVAKPFGTEMFHAATRPKGHGYNPWNEMNSLAGMTRVVIELPAEKAEPAPAVVMTAAPETPVATTEEVPAAPAVEVPAEIAEEPTSEVVEEVPTPEVEVPAEVAEEVPTETTVEAPAAMTEEPTADQLEKLEMVKTIWHEVHGDKDLPSEFRAMSVEELENEWNSLVDKLTEKKDLVVLVIDLHMEIHGSAPSTDQIAQWEATGMEDLQQVFDKMGTAEETTAVTATVVQVEETTSEMVAELDDVPAVPAGSTEELTGDLEETGPCAGINENLADVPEIPGGVQQQVATTSLAADVKAAALMLVKGGMIVAGCRMLSKALETTNPTMSMVVLALETEFNSAKVVAFIEKNIK